jgi:hypothetical protein
LIALGPACSRHADKPTPPQHQTVMIWRAVGSWSGHGNTQTESFRGESGALRVRWETANESPAGSGTFRLAAHSAISGRELEQVVDHRGVGSGTGYVGQEPHVFYMVVESDHVDWKFTVDEGIAGQAARE